ncbi:MAG: hypothetical protein J2P28_20265, partial [Actinobacteria bacterium]|nr:hypothetical protein [Actinomycetota bacterium]
MSHYPAETGGLDPAGAGEPAGRSPASRPGFFSRLGTGWRRYRAWRRSRPFWAGIWLVIAGAELLLIPLPIHSMGLILHIGIGGISGILIGAILVLLGLLLWVHPAQRLFYSIVAALLAVAALVASNLGGFLLGTVLGIIGASLGFAWMPGRPERRRRRRQPEPAGPDSDTEAGVTPGSGREPGTIVRGVAVLPLIAMLLGLPQFLANVVAADPSPGATASATPDPSASPSPAP